MIQNLVNDSLVLDTGNHPGFAPTLPAIRYVDVEHALQALRLSHSLMALFWCFVLFRLRRLLSLCEHNAVKYAVGFGGNAKLKKHYATEIDYFSGLWEAVEQADEDVKKLQLFHEQTYRAKSWKHDRRVIAKLEHNAFGGNQRYIVTILDGDALGLCAVLDSRWRFSYTTDTPEFEGKCIDHFLGASLSC